MTERKLEKRIYKLPNADKKNHEVWYPGRDLLNIPAPYRIGLMAPPNRGKSTLIKNILLRADPLFNNIILIHPDQESDEYSDVRATVMNTIPAPEDWKYEGKTLCIVDDIELKLLDKTQKSNLDRLFGYVSTHKNVSCMITSQDGYNIPPSVRRNLNVYVIWKTPDIQAVSGLIRKAGLTSEHTKKIFKRFKSNYDSFMIDLTNKSPAHYRINGYEIINEDFFET
jgi:hypothetical protein